MSLLSFLAVLLFAVFALRLTFRHVKAWYAVKIEANEIMGNDGLTDAERVEYATRYRNGAGSPVVSDEERVILNRLKENRSN
jgi:hypothetical protein